MVIQLLKYAAHALHKHELLQTLLFYFHLFGRGFNDAINGFNDDGWSVLSCDSAEDVTVAINSSKNLGTTSNTLPLLRGILCAKASMLLQVNNKWMTYTLNIYHPTFEMLSSMF